MRAVSSVAENSRRWLACLARQQERQRLGDVRDDIVASENRNTR